MHIKTFYSHIMCVSSLWNPCNPGNVPFVICKPSKNEANYVRSIVAETLHLWNSWICLAMMLGKKSKKFSQRWIPWYNPKKKSPTTNESPWTDCLCLCNKTTPPKKVDVKMSKTKGAYLPHNFSKTPRYIEPTWKLWHTKHAGYIKTPSVRMANPRNTSEFLFFSNPLVQLTYPLNIGFTNRQFHLPTIPSSGGYVSFREGNLKPLSSLLL